MVSLQFIALGTDDGTIKLLDHSGTVLKDREYHVVSSNRDLLGDVFWSWF